MTTQIALAALDGGGKPIVLRADLNPDGTIALRASLEVGGVAVSPAAPLPVADANGAAYQGVVPITPGTPVAPLRSLGYVVTVSGDVTLTFADGSTMPLYLAAAPTFQTLPFAITLVVLGSGTAATFWNLK